MNRQRWGGSRYACLGYVVRVYDPQQQFPLPKDLASKVTIRFFLHRQPSLPQKLEQPAILRQV